MSFGFGLAPSYLLARSGGFSPRQLFAAGEQGAWYDPSDLTTLFQDAAGTTPTTMETRARLMRDKSGRGNHATAPSDASSPILRARYNLLQYSEDFSNGYWNVKSNSSISANVAVAPDGTTTGDKLVENTANGQHWVGAASTGVATVVGVTYAVSVYAKQGERGYISLYGDAGNGSLGLGAVFNLTNGTVYSAAVGVTASITSAGSGWYRCAVTSTAVSNSTLYPYVGLRQDSTPNVESYIGDGASGAFIWGAQAILATDAALNIPAYQRVGNGSPGVFDYDTAGFPPYLRFETDDSFSTASIDFTGTPQMTVFAGVTKLSDANFGCLIELSAEYSTNNGSFTVFSPGSIYPTGFDAPYRGTAISAMPGFAAAAPTNRVNAILYDISAPSCVIRSNASQVFSGTQSVGTGNFGNYPLFIGRRNNSTFPLNGRIYSLIIRGASTTTPLIASTEQWVAGKMRLTI